VKSLVITVAFILGIIAAGLVFVVAKESDPITAAHGAKPGSSAGSTQLASVESMVGGLEQRLADQPDDGKGWLLLAKSYRHMGRMDDAREAYSRAESLGSGDPIVAAQLYGLQDKEMSQ
jgi:cytochrome c-type biogenesis protein CcmH